MNSELNDLCAHVLIDHLGDNLRATIANALSLGHNRRHVKRVLVRMTRKAALSNNTLTEIAITYFIDRWHGPPQKPEAEDFHGNCA